MKGSLYKYLPNLCRLAGGSQLGRQFFGVPLTKSLEGLYHANYNFLGALNEFGSLHRNIKIENLNMNFSEPFPPPVCTGSGTLVFISYF